MVFVSGQSWDPRDGRPYKGDAAAQTRVALENMRMILEAAKSSMDNVMKVTVYVRNMEDLDKIRDTRIEYFGKSPPASVIVEVNKLWHEDVLVEIDAIAVTDK